MTRGKKATQRKIALYPRVSTKAADWVATAATATNKSQSEILDTVLSNFAAQFNSKSSIKRLFTTYASKV